MYGGKILLVIAIINFIALCQTGFFLVFCPINYTLWRRLMSTGHLESPCKTVVLGRSVPEKFS
jgi:hypothetical protein